MGIGLYSEEKSHLTPTYLIPESSSRYLFGPLIYLLTQVYLLSLLFTRCQLDGTHYQQTLSLLLARLELVEGWVAR